MIDNNQPLTVFIITVGGIITTWLTLKYQAYRKSKRQPIDRIEQIFSGYERLLKRKEEDDKRKDLIITGLENVIQELRKDAESLKDRLDESDQIIKDLRIQLDAEHKTNESLRQEINHMKAQYSKGSA